MLSCPHWYFCISFFTIIICRLSIFSAILMIVSWAFLVLIWYVSQPMVLRNMNLVVAWEVVNLWFFFLVNCILTYYAELISRQNLWIWKIRVRSLMGFSFLLRAYGIFCFGGHNSQLNFTPLFCALFSVPNPSPFSLCPLSHPFCYFFFLVRLSIGYDDHMSSCKSSSPDDCVKFVLGSSLGVLVSFSSCLCTTDVMPFIRHYQKNVCS